MQSKPVRLTICLLLPVAMAFLSIACSPPEEGLQGGDPTNDSVEQPLVPANAEELEAYLKRAVELHLPNARPMREGDLVLEPAAPFITPRFSTTNLQTAGVDEADLVKFDGETLFVARQPVYSYFGLVAEPRSIIISTEPLLAPIAPIPDIEPATIAVYSTSEDPAEAVEIASIPLSETASIEGMMLLPGDDDGPPLLAVIGADRDEMQPWFGPTDVSLFYHGDSRVRLWIFDVSDPSEPRGIHRSKLEGSLLAVRRIGEQLVLVTRFTPFVRYVTLEGDEVSRTQTLADLDVDELLPRAWIEQPREDEPRPLVLPEHCFVPRKRADADERNFYHPTLVTISMLDLRAPEEPVSICAAGPADRVYSSTDALYLASTMWRDWNQTVVHKFAYSERGGAEFRGSGLAEGIPGGTDPDFGLGEVDDVFGIMTTVSSRTPEGRFESAPRLTLLAEAEDGSRKLEELSHLPNEREPDRIGKPGEQLHAVRFLGNRVYAVTFRRIDPLYVIDIEDPRNPFIAGELEVPGFSDLLQLVGPDLLLGVGKDTVTKEGMDWMQGVKLELFDVFDPSSPVSVDSIVIGRRGSETAARTDHHALSALDLGDGTTRVAIPIDVAESPPEAGDPEDPTMWHPWSRTGLHLFEVDHDAPSLQEAGAIIVAKAGDEEAHRGTWHDRSRLQGSAVHYVHDGAVWSAPWDAPDDPVGPR